MKTGEKMRNLLKNELVYSTLLLIIISAFLVFGIIYLIPRFGVAWFFFIELFIAISVMIYYYLKYGTPKSRIAIEEKYYTMQIRRLNDQKSTGYIDDQQYKERIKEFEKKLKK